MQQAEAVQALAEETQRLSREVQETEEILNALQSEFPDRTEGEGA